jgi:Skp family chaperone for outer membrane proteins
VKKQHIVIAILTAAVLAGCTGASTNNSPVGLIDIQRVVSNWTEYQSYQNQLTTEEQAITQGKGSNDQKRTAAMALQAKYGKITDQMTQQIRDAANKIAVDKGLKLVVTREGVGYGGVDITPDVEKAMNISEKASPAPSP